MDRPKRRAAVVSGFTNSVEPRRKKAKVAVVNSSNNTLPESVSNESVASSSIQNDENRVEDVNDHDMQSLDEELSSNESAPRARGRPPTGQRRKKSAYKPKKVAQTKKAPRTGAAENEAVVMHENQNILNEADSVVAKSEVLVMDNHDSIASQPLVIANEHLSFSNEKKQKLEIEITNPATNKAYRITIKPQSNHKKF